MKLAPDEFTGRRFGKYEVLCRLAVGGMAEIFLGFARTGPFMNRPVVLKNILPEQREDPVALQMLLDEARVTATLSHANVAQVVDLERAGEDVLMVIEFIQGANLEEIVDAWTKQGEPVPLGYAISAIREAAQGLAHAHLHKNAQGQAQPIVHRDVTPRNVMTGFDGATKMLDFGIARAMGAQRRTVAGMVRGTTAYMSPEQAIGKDLDPRSDLFSIGIIFHELLTGQRLFFRGNPGAEMAAVYESEIPLPSKVNRRVPKQLDAVVMKALERNRDKRYQSALDLIRDLSLAAGSTAWSKERCAEMVIERFTERRRDMGKLLERVPAAAAPPSSTDQHEAFENEGRTVMVQRPRAAPPPVERAPPSHSDEVPLKTLMESGPEIAELRERARKMLDSRKTAPGVADEPETGDAPALAVGSGRIPPMPVEGRRQRVQATPNPQPARPTTPQPQPAQKQGTPQPQPARKEDLGQELFGDLDAGAERTKVLTNAPASRRALANVQTDPQRDAVPRPAPEERSRVPVILAVLIALVVGAGGAIGYMRMTRPSGVGRLSLKTDRAVAVEYQGTALGATPLDVVVPSGRLSLRLIEPDGTRREVLIDVDPGQRVERSITLDSLQKLP